MYYVWTEIARPTQLLLVCHLSFLTSCIVLLHTLDGIYWKNRARGTAVIDGVWETYRGTRWEDRGPLLGGTSTDPNTPPPQPQVVTVSAKVLSKKNFYEERPGFNPMSLLKNPMILLAIVALAITFGMPKLMENMDPEMKAEYEEMQKKSAVSGLTRAMQGQGPASSAAGSFDLAGWMAGAQQQQGSTKTSGLDAKDGGSLRERRR